MNFLELQLANETINMKPIKSKKGATKDFAGVDEKIKAFRMLYPDGGIITNVVTITETMCVFHAEVTDDLGRVLGSGTACKYASDDNSDTYIEACESAAVGRALRFVGIGLTNVTKVTPIEDETAKLIELGALREKILSYTKRHNFTDEKIKAVCDRYQVEQIMDLNLDCCRHYIEHIKKNGGDINE